MRQTYCNGDYVWEANEETTDDDLCCHRIFCNTSFSNDALLPSRMDAYCCRNWSDCRISLYLLHPVLTIEDEKGL